MDQEREGHHPSEDRSSLGSPMNGQRGVRKMIICR